MKMEAKKTLEEMKESFEYKSRMLNARTMENEVLRQNEGGIAHCEINYYYCPLL